MPKLLVIDDEVDLCELIAELATDKNINVQTISDSSAVAAAVDAFMPDAIMLDLMMPGMDGVELLRVLADKAKSAKIALMSGSDARVLNSARRLGSAHGLNIITTLEKPLEIATIRSALDELLASSTAAPVTAADLSLALAAGQLGIVLQPVVNKTGTVLAAEIFPRWPQADGTVLTAGEFIDKARADGLLGQLTQDLLDLSFSQVTAPLPLAFNIVPDQLADPFFITRLLDTAAAKGRAPSAIALEISEQPLMAELALPDSKLERTLAELKLSNVQIWLDEYQGRLALNDLMRLPLTGLKLSRSLIQNLTDDNAMTIRAACALAAARQLPVYAVGVETAAQQVQLAELGVAGYQGNLIAEAAAPAGFAAWLAARG